jgi:hypothetical protein
MRAALVAALLCSAASGQVIVDAARVGTAAKWLDEPKDERPLQCTVHPLHPALNFTLRFQAGYLFSVPLKQYTGTGHIWALVTRITPRDGDAKPVFLLDVMHLPPIPPNKADGQAGGSYLLGEGHYDVAWLLIDDAGRTCRKSWHVDASLGHGEKQVKMVTNRRARSRRTAAPSYRFDGRRARLISPLQSRRAQPLRSRPAAGHALRASRKPAERVCSIGPVQSRTATGTIAPRKLHTRRS